MALYEMEDAKERVILVGVQENATLMQLVN